MPADLLLGNLVQLVLSTLYICLGFAPSTVCLGFLVVCLINRWKNIHAVIKDCKAA